MSGPIDSRRNTYCPPARGNIAASSPYERAPSSVITPVTIHAIRSQKGEPSVRDILAETMKIPEPIIEPATSIVASVRVIALTNSGFDCCVGIVDPEPVFGAATLVIRLLVIARNRDHQAADGDGLPEAGEKSCNYVRGATGSERLRLPGRGLCSQPRSHRRSALSLGSAFRQDEIRHETSCGPERPSIS